SRESRKRLEAMCQTNDGFRLSELDLELRGAGDVNGTLQSGEAISLRIANPTRDVEILNLTRDVAAATLAVDPTLSAPQNHGLQALKRAYSGKESIDFSMIS
ncbi:MAG: ATP-dependent DNA helicase RecG, partial [Rikenellaceae bacterium]